MKQSLNCYIGGRKCAVAMSEAESAVILFSHSSGWDGGVRFPNMLGWKFARLFSVAGLPACLADAAAFVGSSLGLPVVLEGSAEYDEIRANIRRVNRARRRAAVPAAAVVSDVPAAEPVTPAEPVVPAEPAEPVVVSRPAPGRLLPAGYDKILDTSRRLGCGFGIYLYGPAGCGKSYLGRLLAEDLGVEFHSHGCINDPVELEGYRDAMGVYHETEFYRAFKNGGLFLFDEMDVSIPESLKKINDALANGVFDFAGDVVRVHPSFRIIAAGNTVGKGASSEYVGNVLDPSTLDRFPVRLSMDYDRRVEAGICKDSALIDFVHDLRAAAKKAGVFALFSYRCLAAWSLLSGGLVSVSDFVKNGLFGGWELDDVRMVLRSCKDRRDVNPWHAAAFSLAGM